MSELKNTDYEEKKSVMQTHSPLEREKDTPESRHEPVPVWAFLVASLALLGGGSYLGANNNGFEDSHIPSGYVAETLGGAEGPVGPAPMTVDRWVKMGKREYATCAGCHMNNGIGNASLNIPPLAGSEWVSGSSKRMAAIIIRGLQGPIEVAGKTYNGGVMGAQGGLSDKQIAQVMTYVREEFGQKGDPSNIITPDMVAEFRASISGESGLATAQWLKGTFAQDAHLEGDPSTFFTGDSK